jgi:transcription initiation factor TFIID subunit TAF12
VLAWGFKVYKLLKLGLGLLEEWVNKLQLGSQQQQADLSRLGFQGQMGEQQQQQQQQIINQAIQDYALSQEMPMQRLAGYNALLRGYATPTTTTSQYQAQPSGLQQLAGLGTTAAGIGTIAGGVKKKAA